MKDTPVWQEEQETIDGLECMKDIARINVLQWTLLDTMDFTGKVQESGMSVDVGASRTRHTGPGRDSLLGRVVQIMRRGRALSHEEVAA